MHEISGDCEVPCTISIRHIGNAVKSPITPQEWQVNARKIFTAFIYNNGAIYNKTHVTPPPPPIISLDPSQTLLQFRFQCKPVASFFVDAANDTNVKWNNIILRNAALPCKSARASNTKFMNLIFHVRDEFCLWRARNRHRFFTYHPAYT